MTNNNLTPTHTPDRYNFKQMFANWFRKKKEKRNTNAWEKLYLVVLVTFAYTEICIHTATTDTRAGCARRAGEPHGGHQSVLETLELKLLYTVAVVEWLYFNIISTFSIFLHLFSFQVLTSNYSINISYMMFIYLLSFYWKLPSLISERVVRNDVCQAKQNRNKNE